LSNITPDLCKISQRSVVALMARERTFRSRQESQANLARCFRISQIQVPSKVRNFSWHKTKIVQSMNG
jgi:hypothetical protein